MQSLQEAAWRRWHSHPQFEIIAWSLLRDTEAKLHREISAARARRKILRSHAFSQPRSPRPESLRKALHWESWPSSLPTCLEMLSTQESQTDSVSSPTRCPSCTPAGFRSEHRKILPSVLQPEALATTDRLWELHILGSALRAGSPVLRTELEIPLRGLGHAEEQVRAWAVQSGWISLLATHSPDDSRSSGFENSVSAPARFHWYFTSLPRVAQPRWEDLWSLISL